MVATDAPAMLEEGQKLARLHPQIVVKCPVTIDGLKATKALSARGIKVNVTLIFSPLQGLAAAKCGASYISPFIGRLDDIGQDGVWSSISWSVFCATTTTRRRCWSRRSDRRPSAACGRGRGTRGDAPAQRHEANCAASADRCRPRKFPRRLAQDQAKDLAETSGNHTAAVL